MSNSENNDSRTQTAVNNISANYPQGPIAIMTFDATYVHSRRSFRDTPPVLDAPLSSHLIFSSHSGVRDPRVNVRSRLKKVSQTSRAREGEEVERGRRQRRFLRIVSANGARSERLGVGETRDAQFAYACSRPVRSSFGGRQREQRICARKRDAKFTAAWRSAGKTGSEKM